MNRFSVLACVIPLLAVAGTIEHSLTVHPSDMTIENLYDYDYISLPGFTHLSEPGSPALPVLYLSFVIPPDAQYEKLEIVQEHGEYLPGTYSVFPAQKPVPLSSIQEAGLTRGDKEIYSSNTLFPCDAVNIVSEGNLSGYRIVSVAVTPLRYLSATKKLHCMRELSFRLHYENGASSVHYITEKQKQDARERVLSLVANPEQVDDFSPPLRQDEGIWQSEYIIITDTAFVDDFQRLRDWKMKKGVLTDIVTTSWIYSNYSGIDGATKIRNFIKQAADSGAMYFMLAGQCDWERSEEIVPRRDAFCMVTGQGSAVDEDTIPCDAYYSGLNGTWDGNGNGTYGEMNDNVDLYNDVYVGRAPVKNSTQIDNFISKVITYETAPSFNYVEKIILATGNLWSGNHGNGPNDTIADTIPDHWQKSKLYEDYGLMSRYIVRDSINQGFNLCHQIGHGNQTVICYNYGSGTYYKHRNPERDPATQTNDSTEAVIVTNEGCWCGAFDKGWADTDNDCLAENMITTNKNCATATIMNSRFGWGYEMIPNSLGPSGEFSVWFYRKLFGTPAYHIGQALATAKDQLVSKSSSNTFFRWIHYTWNLVGDPEMPIWTDVPGTLIVTHASYVYAGIQTYTVTVKNGNNVLLDSALVCCWIKNQEPLMHVTKYTNTSGIANLTITPTTPNDTMYVTVTKRNYVPYQGHALVIVSVPEAPAITKVEKSVHDVVVFWRPVTTDTFGNPESVAHYAVYRDTSPAFIPGVLDSIGAVVPPDTAFVDADAMTSTENFFYLIKAVDNDSYHSKKSNMGYKYNKFANENATTTDRNWVSLPWYNSYSNASSVTTDLSPLGDPLTKITNLRDDQYYESWLWDPDFGEWYGTDFAITSGRGYEMAVMRDATLAFVGCENPNGLVPLIENPTTTDRNWVSIPYNHVYSTVSDITTEYSPVGNPLSKLTNLRDDNKYESWLWDPDFGEWYGVDFAIERGRGYEFVTVVDTTWNPTEYTNEPGVAVNIHNKHCLDGVVCGTAVSSERTPLWMESNGRYIPVSKQSVQVAKEQGISHIVRARIAAERLEGIVFTVYRPLHPYDALTEEMIGSGVAQQKGTIWFDAGNFSIPWRNGQEALLIIETRQGGSAYYAAKSFIFDATTDIQELDDVSLVPLSEWMDNVVGYSVYKNGQRLNNEVLLSKECAIDKACVFKPVIRGGYETAYSSGEQGSHQGVYSYACMIHPTPFRDELLISYQVADHSTVTVYVYDAAGRQVRTLVDCVREPGSYTVVWNGHDNLGRALPTGIYFIQFKAQTYSKVVKAILLQ